MYVKLFSQILNSSIWLEEGDTRLVWITLLAAMDEEGFAQFAAPGNLANTARVSLEACTSALEILEGPDPNSSDPDNEGRRIERVPGGYLILNAAKYRALGSRENKKVQTRVRVAKWKKAQREAKAKAKATIRGNAGVTQGNARLPSGNAEVRPGNSKVRHAEADTDTEEDYMAKSVGKGESEGGREDTAIAASSAGEEDKTRPLASKQANAAKRPQICDEVFLAGLKANAAYEGLEIERELGKASAWCVANNRVCTRRFFVNWINRAERPLTLNQEANGNGRLIKGDTARRETTRERRRRETIEYGEALKANRIDTARQLVSGLPRGGD